jgi:hypothetical protein
MTAPFLTQGTHGNVVATGTSLGAGKTGAVFYDASPYFETQMTIAFATGGVIAATLGCTFEFYCVYDTGTTISSNIAAGAASVTVGSGTGVTANQRIFLAGNTAPTGEIVTITNVAGNVLTISPVTQYAHNSGNAVKLIEQSPTHLYTPAGYLGAAYAINTPYSKTQFIGPAQWVVQFKNLDVTNAITVEISAGTIIVQ